MNIAFIGAGRIATAIAIRLHNQNYNITHITSKIENYSAARLAERVNAKIGIPHESDILFFAVPDDAIYTVAQGLASAPPRSAFVHLSGVHNLDVLSPLRQYAIGSFHPVYPFTPHTRLSGNENMLIGIQASTPTLTEKLTTIAHDVGGSPAVIDSSKKTLYHAAAVVASNYLVVLYAAALDMLKSSGVSEDVAKTAIHQLMQGNLNNLLNFDPSHALTGPVARGDVETIQKHVDALFLNDYAKIYSILGQYAVELADLDLKIKKHLLTLLKDSNHEN